MSDSRGFEPKGGRVNGLGALTPRARSLATRLSTDRVPFARLLAVNRTLYKETVTLEVSVEVPQVRNYDIRPRERVSVEFQPAGDSEPMVWALRQDFPPVPHAYRLSSRADCCLCLYEDPWSEVKLSWTPERFVSRLREWLAQAATGKLLNPDLPMEPLLGVFRTVVVPPKLLSEPKAAKLKMFRHGSGSVWQVRYECDAPVTTTPRPIDCLGITVRSDPQTQSVSESRPITFGSLVRMLHRFGIDILAELRSKLAKVRIGTNLREPRILLVVDIPKRRYEDSEPESTDIFAFLLQENRFSYLMDLLGPADSRCDQAYEAWRPSLEMVALTCFGAVTELSVVPRTGDSGAAEPGPKCVAVGQGALGSQVVANAVRADFGTWTVVDRDVLLPHNLLRHALLDAETVGSSKALAMASVLSRLIHGRDVEGLDADILRPDLHQSKFESALLEAELIVDFSASAAVERHLAIESGGSARRVSFFLSPNAECLVMLAEGTERTIKLDELEAQFFGLLVRNRSLRKFYRNPAARVRYGARCGEVSSKIPQDRVGLHAGIAASALRNLRDEASVSVWRLTAGLAVERHAVIGAPCKWFDLPGWRVGIDETTQIRLASSAATQEPAGARGVLLGIVDTHHKRTWVVEGVPAAPGSRPKEFGSSQETRDISGRIWAISERTAQAVQYIGAWVRNFPDGSLELDAHDHELLAEIARNLSTEGVPGFLLIVSEHRIRFHISWPDKRELTRSSDHALDSGGSVEHYLT